MDPEVRARFWESIRRVNREEGTTLFLTTQYLDEAERHADQLALLHHGRIAYRGTVESFVRESGRTSTEPATATNHISLEEGYLAYLANTQTTEVTNAAH